jgi:SAM-dependent methyltransferase
MRILRLGFVALVACAAPEAHHHHGHDWNAVYKEGSGFTHAPNALLKSAVEGVTPGDALDVGMGQGRNALFLARAGWRVTGFDPAVEGIHQAQQAAADEHLTLDARVDDAEHFDFGSSRYDLVALVYVGGSDIAPSVIQALRPGGRVVVEFFQQDDAKPFNVPGSFKVGELEALFKRFEVLRSEAVEDVADWSLKKDKLVRFVARKPEHP